MPSPLPSTRSRTPAAKAKPSAMLLGAVAFAWLVGSLSFGAFEVWTDHHARSTQLNSQQRDPGLLSPRLRWVAALILASGLLSWVVAWLLVLRLRKLILKPIHSLTEASRRVAETQDLGIRVLVPRNHELAHLAETFNGMLQALQARHRTLARPRPLAEEPALPTPDLQPPSAASSDLLAAMSREFRTPLNGILGMSGFLLEENLTPDSRHFSRSIEQSAEALLAIINDILDFSRLEAGQIELDHLIFNPRHTVEDVLDSIAPQAAAKHLGLCALFEADIPEWVEGDPGCIRQVLLNLLGNALAFTERGEVRVGLGLSPEGALRFEVQDSGLGMSAATLSRLFRPYTQADHASTRRFAGSGLGLAISRSLVELMGGAIGVDSREGEGSRFWFTAALTPCEGPGPGPDPMAPLLAATQHPGPRVLLAGPSTGSLRSLETHLKELGVDLRRCGGAETLDTLTVRGFDLAILSPEGPELDSLLARAHNLREAGAPPLVLFSTFVQRGQARLAHRAGFAGFLCRPLRFPHVQTVLTGVLQKHPFLITRHQFEERQGSARKRVLVIQADEADRLHTCRLLQAEGWKAYWTATATSAAEALHQRPYDLILLDLDPEGTGAAEALQQLRASGSMVPVVGLMASPAEGAPTQPLPEGLEGSLAKPVGAADLQGLLVRFRPQA